MKSYKIKLTPKDRREREANLIAVSPIYAKLRETVSINLIRKTLNCQWYQVYDKFLDPGHLTLIQIVKIQGLLEGVPLIEVLMLCSVNLESAPWYELSSANEGVLTERFGSK